LFLPLLTEETLPYIILEPLVAYLQNPSATTQSNSALVKALRNFDEQQEEGKMALANLEAGAIFELNGRHFEKGELRRTRYLCTDKTNGKRYVVSAIAMVKKV
jgi:hypothetical protein